MERVIGFLLEVVIYPFIMHLERKKYVIPVDTKKDNIIRQNTLVNIVGLGADSICAILTLIGMSQHILTYIGMLTISMYIFVDHFKVYCEQYKIIKEKTHVCKVRQKSIKYLKWYTPNLRNIIIASMFFLILLFMIGFETSQYYTTSSEIKYKILMGVMMACMMYIKIKYYFLDTFDIKECVFEKIEG